MISIDELREQTYASQDPQFHDPDAYDQDAWLEKLSEVDEHIDDAIMCLQAANEMHELNRGDKIINLLKEAAARLEEEC